MVSLPHLVPPKVERSGDTTVLTFTGRAAGVENMLGNDFDRRTNAFGAEHLLLDFRKVDLIGGRELGSVIKLHRKMRSGG